ncbi:MAG: hypothetical protein AAFR32_00270 [Pseudomonadota bacterium]
MIAALQQRPWPIHAYAVIALAVGLEGYIGALFDLSSWELVFEDTLPHFAWNRDWTIVTLSARFTVVCIPVAAIWIWGARFARTLFTLFTFILGAGLIRTLAEGTAEVAAWDMAKIAALIFACALLFTPSANRWLTPLKEPGDAEVFE